MRSAVGKSKANQANIDTAEPIHLYRAGTVVSSLLSAFGRSPRETRVTAFLGYLIALRPDAFLPLFGLDGRITSVSLENTEKEGRTDIAIGTDKGICVIEAKLGALDPTEQVTKYDAKWRVILSGLPGAPQGKNPRGLQYVSWQDVADWLSKVAKQGPSYFKSLCLDLRRHMEEQKMIKQNNPVEVYAREINSQDTLTLFLHSRLYVCTFERSSKLAEAIYFTPHFGVKIANLYPGINQGISYISRIEQVEVVDSWKNMCDCMKRVRGNKWFNNNKGLLKKRFRKQWKHDFSMVFLGEPRLVFNPPIKKDNLQEGKGWLSKRVFSFDELFEAWGK